MKQATCVFSLVLLVLASSASGRTWYITPDGLGDAPTIQAGTDSAAAGDTVSLADGTYTGPGNRDIDFLGKAICVRSESDDPTLCIIDCEGSESDPHRGFGFHSSEGPASVLEGVTIRNGVWSQGGGGGGGIGCYQASSPTIRNTMLAENRAFSNGGGLECTGGSSPVLDGVVFFGNRAYHGGGASFSGGSPRLTDCVFEGNYGNVSGGGVSCDKACDLELVGASFKGNQGVGLGGGITLSGSSAMVANVTFVANRAQWGNGLCLILGASASLDRVIIAYGTEGEAIVPDGTVYLSCCDIYGNAGGDWVGGIAGQLGIDGNFSACPSFCSVGMGDYHLCNESPCAPGNHPDGYDCGLIGAWDVGCSCGPTETQPSTWSMIKSMYK